MTKRTKAVFTIVQDEPEFLPLWVRHYLPEFGAENVFILNHNSKDKTVQDQEKRFKVKVIDLHYQESFNHKWLSETVKQFQAFLLHTSYQKVLFAEVDEFVIVDSTKDKRTLGQYIEDWQGIAGQVTGYQVLHDIQNDFLENIDWEKSVLKQNRKIIEDFDYDKVLLSTIPLDWGYGFHYVKSQKEQVSKTDLMLVHLHYADFKTALSRNQRRRKRKWSKEDFKKGTGVQNWLIDEDLAVDFISQFKKFEGHTKAKDIPKEWEDLIKPL